MRWLSSGHHDPGNTAVASPVVDDSRSGWAVVPKAAPRLRILPCVEDDALGVSFYLNWVSLPVFLVLALVVALYARHASGGSARMPAAGPGCAGAAGRGGMNRLRESRIRGHFRPFDPRWQAPHRSELDTSQAGQGRREGKSLDLGRP